MARPAGGGGPTVPKGGFTIITGSSARTVDISGEPDHPFMFNPNDIDDTKATIWGMIEVPGMSHPIYQFGAGGERLIRFNLYIDGDRGRAAQAGARIPNDPGLDITLEIRYFRSLVYPTQYNSVFANVFPPLVLFNFGTLYSNVRCLVKKADPKVTYWVPDAETGVLIPVRATIAIELAEIPEQSVLDTDVRFLSPGT